VLAAAATAGGSAIALDGKMVDRPVVERAQRNLDAAYIEKP
jgi:citrate lyase subunit beta/citryl-CoA lyase